MAYGKSKDIVERTQSEKVLRDKTFMKVLMFYCNYVGGTFCDAYVGRSFCWRYEGGCFYCNHAGDIFYIALCTWLFLL